MTLSFELGGTRLERDDSAGAAAKQTEKPTEKGKGKDQTLPLLQSPLSVKCEQIYIEKTMAVPTERSAAWRSVRWYEKASAQGKQGSLDLNPSLRKDRSLVAVEVDPPESTVFSPQGPLSYDEWDMVELTGNSLILDLLLPAGKVALGDSWQPSDRVLASLLTLDRVTTNEVQCTLKEATKAVARFEINGKLAGVKNDIAAKMELKGKYRFDFRLNRIDWFGLLVAEQRDVGAFEAGYDVVLKTQVLVVPAQGCDALTDAALKKYSLEPTPEATRLHHASSDGAWQITADRRWYLRGESAERALFRLVDRGSNISQCVISPKAKTSFDRLPTLAQFQQDIQQALDTYFGEFVAAGERVNGADYRVLRVAVRGEVPGGDGPIPIEWRYYHVADRDGRQAVLLFTQEAKQAERLDGLDTAFVDSFRFNAETKPAADAKKPAAGAAK